MTMGVRLLAVEDVDRYLALVVEVEAGSGVDGEGHSHAYSSSEPFDLVAGRAREVMRWSTAVGEVGEAGWRRAWGLVDPVRQDTLVGYLHLGGGELRSEQHRAEMGMGIVGSHRRRGGGSLLLRTAIEWARQQPTIEWIDLGVFSDNPGAYALYERHGFTATGRTDDRYRIDGHSVAETTMTLHVADPTG